MGDVQIKDGTGNGGFGAVVNKSGRLHVDAVERSQNDQASINGVSYNINTGLINLTSANTSAVFYLKNTGVNDIILTSLFYLLGNSSGGAGDVLITVLRNPTTGTIIDNALVMEMPAINRNFGSQSSLDIDAFKGAEGNTFTNGSKVIESIFNQSPTRQTVATGTIVLPKGTSIGIEIKPAIGNASLSVEFAASAFEEVSN